MDLDAFQIYCRGTYPEYVDLRFSCDGFWFSRKLIFKFLKTLYTLVILSIFQPRGGCAVVRVQDYYAGGNGFDSCSQQIGRAHV